MAKKEEKIKKVKEVVEEELTKEKKEKSSESGFTVLPQKVISTIADEVAKTVVERIPHIIPRPARKTAKKSNSKKIENALFLDTSAIIDGRIFEVFNLGLVSGYIVVAETILLELKHIADSQDLVKRERGEEWT